MTDNGRVRIAKTRAYCAVSPSSWTLSSSAEIWFSSSYCSPVHTQCVGSSAADHRQRDEVRPAAIGVLGIGVDMHAFGLVDHAPDAFWRRPAA